MNFINPLKSAYNTLGGAAVKLHAQYPKTYEYLHSIGSAGTHAAVQGTPLTSMAMAALAPAVSSAARKVAPNYADRVNSLYSAATKLSSAIMARNSMEKTRNAYKPY